MKSKILLITLVFLAFAPSLRTQARTVGLDYSTYFGGNEPDEGNAIAVDTAGSVYVAGVTCSFNFPTADPYQSSIEATAGPSWYADVFVSKLSSTGSELIYSTYLGGERGDSCNAVSIENDCVYLVGHTASADFPTANPYQASRSRDYDYQEDVFVSKLSSSGSSLLYSTYLGGWYTENGEAISVLDGSAYIAGWTKSTDFPLVTPYQSSKGESSAAYRDAFVAKLAPSGSILIYSTYLGGQNNDQGQGVSVDSEGFAYLAGYTTSADFPVTAFAFQTANRGSKDVFVAGLSSNGVSLLYSTYLGGSSDDAGYGISLESGSAYVTGYSDSFDFPTVNPYQAAFAGTSDTDAFVSRLSSAGSALLYSTYLGGHGDDYGYGIAVDNGEAYVVGYTESTDLPLVDAYQSDPAGACSAFVGRLSSSGSTLVYSTYLGGSGRDWGSGIAVENEAAYVTGYTESLDFPTVNPYQAAFDGGLNKGDAFIGKLVWPAGPTPVPTATLMPSATPTPSYTPIATATPTVTPLVVPSLTPATTPSPTITPSPIPTPQSLIPIIDSGDYNGDGTSDIAIFRGSSGLWSIRGVTRVYYGSSSDIPVSGDYDGDGSTDIGIFRGNSGLWGVRNVTRIYCGSSGDRPVPGDYDGDGSCDVGVFRNSSGLWAVAGVTRVYFGGSGDRPVPGDYDGDGSGNIAIFRLDSGLWAIRDLPRIYYGSSSDTAVSGDYDGDGTWEAGIFRPSTGMWGIRGVTRVYYGSAADRAVPADYDGDFQDDIGIFRSSSGLWAIRNITRAYYGAGGDIPVTR